MLSTVVGVRASLLLVLLRLTPQLVKKAIVLLIGSGSTQVLVMHRGGEQEHHRLLLWRMVSLHPVSGTVDRWLMQLSVNVTMDRNLWPLHLVLGVDATVGDLMCAVVAAYVHEGRRSCSGPLRRQ